MTPAERQARRERVTRRARAAAGLPTDILSVTAYGQTMRIWDYPEKIAACWRVGRPYERPLLRHIHQQRFRGVAVDAGANIGNHTLWLAVVCGLRVVAFEPVLHAELQANVTLNRLGSRVQVEPVALGDTDGTAEHVGLGRLTQGVGELPVRRLDAYQLTNVSVVKIDVEGMEPHVLRGGEQTIRRWRPVIFAEEHNQVEHDAIAEVLEPWGYRMRWRMQKRGQATPMGRWDC